MYKSETPRAPHLGSLFCLPRIELRVERERTEPVARPYLRVRRLELSARFGDGPSSEPFIYDIVERRALDAVVVAAHFLDDQGRRNVLLQSALRPPVALRPREVWPIPEKPTLGGLWEVPAGLVEENERSEEGLRVCAARELYEEVGAKLDPSALLPLGPSTFPCPGVIGERHFFFHAAIALADCVPPPEDGSVLERGAAIVPVLLEDALTMVRHGEIEDAKTEIALRRLAEIPL